ncbi:hypothetical protein PGTUg99_029239 [Puccinia graminis f. sp. tritici]|uniref:Extracellular membrane protein CFEM domain-containing protein n=1 Tax=Puccinia graminis f. sp. tritici TaxID=56615 RepID=A0A5B0QM55_PUCGR|nr:hypothetical protein PGTUg99_029239 [Puccinia graminis f. sp. tritici]
MAYLFTRLTLSIAFLLAQLSVLSMAAPEEAPAQTCCPGDLTCSGCWMCPESDLGKCWATAVKEIDECVITDDLPKSADTFCRAFAKLAKCWSTGLCCSEYAPTLAAATNLCNLKTWSPELITREELEKYIEIANATRDAIWNNDSGIDVPKLTVSVEANTSNSTESSPSNSTESSPSISTESTQANSTEVKTNPESTNSTQHTYEKKSVVNPSQADDDEQQTNPREKIDDRRLSSDREGKKDSEKANHRSQSNEKANETSKNSQNCAVKANKHRTKVADQHHKSRSSKTKKSLSKRVENPFHKRRMYHHQHHPDLFKRTAPGEGGCGLDFQGVAYPTEVPPTVAQIFSEL